MEMLFTVEQQNENFDKAKQFYLEGNYEEVESLLRLLMESSFQHKQMDLYVEVMVWLERLYINTGRYYDVYSLVILINPLIEKYGTKTLYLRHRLNQVILDFANRIGDPENDYKLLFEEALETGDADLICTIGNNFMYYYVEYGRAREGIDFYYESKFYYEQFGDELTKMTKYMYAIYCFELFYLDGQLNKCEELLKEIVEKDWIIDSFAYMMPICEGLLLGKRGEVDRGNVLVASGIRENNKFAIKFELKLWLEILKESQRIDLVVEYQNLLIEIYEELFSIEQSNKRNEQMEKLTKQFYEKQLYIDQLTRVQNRNYYEHLIQQQQQLKNYTVFVLDIDRFKQINDTYGHSVGDEVIRFIALQLRQWAPKHDVTIVRYGGDEFLGLIPYVYEEVQMELEQLHQQLMTTTFTTKEGLHIPLSVSIGVAHTEETYCLLFDLFKDADAAIYRAKEQRGAIAL